MSISYQKIQAACLVLLLSSSMGCTAFLAPRDPFPATPTDPVCSNVPRELDMVSLPPYVIEPPDILLINAIKVVPKPPHKIEPFDGLLVRVLGVDDSGAPIAQIYSVDPEGEVDFGPSYGKVKVVGLTIDEAETAIYEYLSQQFVDIQVSTSLAFSAGAQTIAGEHLVGPDGRVNLGTYGSVYVNGMTIDEARGAIEEQLTNYLDDPKVVVDILAYNSKKYYIVTQGAGFGDNVLEAPITGNETVLDGIARIGGLSQLSSSKIWIARPAPNGVGCEQILEVNWDDISRGAATATNYQLMPRDRLYIAEDGLVKLDSTITKFTRPFERLFGFVSLGTGMASRIVRFGLGSLN